MKAVLYGLAVLTGFFLFPLPSPSFFPSLFLFCRLQESWHVASAGRRDGSSIQCKNPPLGKPVSDAWPHGPLTYCLCDLWRLGASGHCRPPSSLSCVSLHPHCRTASSQRHCITFYRSIQRGIPCTCSTAASAPTKINTSINIVSLPHHITCPLDQSGPFDCVRLTISHGVSAVELSASLMLRGSTRSMEVR